MSAEALEKAGEYIKARGKDSKVKDMNNDEKLQLYALYKQGTVGDINTKRPGMLDFEGKAKWDAWEKQKGKSQEEARVEYIALVNTICGKYGVATIPA
jgi:diazepam-binding inhibitor (GABA receptor modulating acyl-CoA-binding protein)